MHKILVFTDIHITGPGETIIDLDPLARFEMGLAHALARHPDAARIVITGDLTHHGRDDEYARLRGALAGCPLPVSLTLGNHDRRAPFDAAFPEMCRTSEGYAQEVIDLGEFRLIVLDTLDEEAPDIHSGYLCDHRLAWLDDALAGARDRQIVVFTHHPPMLTEMKGMDWIGFRNRDALIDRLAAHPAPVQVISGHIHRLISGQARGVPVTILKSTCHQMPMELGWADPHLSVDENGAYGIVVLAEDGPIIHSADFSQPETAPKIDTYSQDMRP